MPDSEWLVEVQKRASETNRRTKRFRMSNLKPRTQIGMIQQDVDGFLKAINNGPQENAEVNYLEFGNFIGPPV